MGSLVNLNDTATQLGFSKLVGTSQPAIAKHVDSGILQDGQTFGQWLIAYCEKLRFEAAGRAQSEARERRDKAQAIESEVNAQLKQRELYRQDQLIVDIESVRTAMSEWIALGKSEFNNAIDRIVTAIESENGITIDRDQLQPDVDAALRAIGDYRFQSGSANSGS